MPDLTVVIAAWRNAAGLARCLDGIRPQLDGRTEVIVVSDASIPRAIASEYERVVEWLPVEGQLLIPQLWARGMARARGDVVAITTAHFLPGADWLVRIRELHAAHDSAAGVGGPIDPPRGRGITDWATYFLRYSNYLNLHGAGEVRDIPGDNAAYKRVDLERHRSAIADGFWEPDFHRLVLAEGRTLYFSPAMRVRQHASFGFRVFCAQRRQHGREFGASRVRGRGWLVHILRAASGVLIPLVLLAKIVGRVLKSRRDYGPLLLCLPVLFAFILAWTWGEVTGYLTAGNPDGSTDKDRGGIE